MKKIFHLIFLSVLSMPLSAQENWVSYSQAIKTEDHESRRFRFEATVRADIEDDSAATHLWARVDKKAGTGFFENMGSRPVRSKEWKTYSIEGKIDSGAQQLAFGFWCRYNGTFYFDAVQLSIETEKGKWTTVVSDGFESADPGKWKQGVRRWEDNGYGYNTLFQAATNTANPFQGQRCLKITGKNVPNYGKNGKAGKYLDVNGIRLYYEVYGSGQPLVLLHTAGGSIEESTQFIPEWAKNHQVIAFDLRGHGNSSGRDSELAYGQMTDDIAKALAGLKIDSAYVWGFSDGAIIGLSLAVNHPRLVKKMLAGVPNILPDTTAIHPVIYQYLQKTANDPADSGQRKLNRWMLSPSGLSFEKLSNIQCPVLIVTGDRDWVKPEHTLRIFQSIPQSQLCVIPGTAHNSPWEKKDLFLQLANDFFDKPFKMPDTQDWFRE